MSASEQALIEQEMDTLRSRITEIEQERDRLRTVCREQADIIRAEIDDANYWGDSVRMDVRSIEAALRAAAEGEEQ